MITNQPKTLRAHQTLFFSLLFRTRLKIPYNPQVSARSVSFFLALSILSGCVSADTRRELDDRRAEVAKLEAHLLKLPADDPKTGEARKAVAEARGRLEQVRIRADKERRASMGFFGALVDKVLAGASPLLSLLVPGGGLGASLAGRLFSTVRDGILSAMRP